MAKIVVFSLCLLLTIKSIAGIECYSCMSSENPDCVEPEKVMKPVKCDQHYLEVTSQYASTFNSDFKQIFDFTTFNEPVTPLTCLKSVVKVSSQEVVIRGCQLPREPLPDVCTKMIDKNSPKSNVQVIHCSLCDADGCNAAPPPPMRTTSLTAALLLAALAVAC